MNTKQFLGTVVLFVLTTPVFGQSALISDSNGDYTIGENLQTGNAWGYGKKLQLSGCEWNTDPMWIAKYSVGSDVSELRIGLGDDMSDKLVIGRVTNFSNLSLQKFMTIGDKVGIGVDNPYYKLEVNGTIRAKEIRVETGWADFVFKESYQLPTLNEVKQHIEESKHLPDMPTEAEVQENGINLAEMQVKLLQKIEELTLYAIQQQEMIEELQAKIENLENKE
jgi:hypothetical protein